MKKMTKRITSALLSGAILMSGSLTSMPAFAQETQGGETPVYYYKDLSDLDASIKQSVVRYMPFEGDCENQLAAPLNIKTRGTIEFVDGLQGQAVHLNKEGSLSDYISLGDIEYGAESFAISFLAKIKTPTTNDLCLVSNKDWQNGSYSGFELGYAHYSNGTDTIRFNSGSGGDKTKRLDLTDGVPALDDTWHHLVMNVDRVNNKVQLFMDGELKKEGSIAAMAGDVMDAGLPTVIGADGALHSYGDQDYLVDELIIHNDSLTAGQAKTLADYELDAASEAKLAGLDASVKTTLRYYLPFDGDYSYTVGAGTQGAYGDITYEEGVNGYAARIDNANGEKDYIDLGTIDYSEDFTFSFFAKVSMTPGTDHIFLSNKDWNGGGNPGWMLGYNATSVNYNVGDGSKRADQKTGMTGALNGGWHHIAAVVDHSAKKVLFYIDGEKAQELSFSTVSSSGFTSALPTIIGADGKLKVHSAPNYLMDELIQNNTALSAEQVKSLYTYFTTNRTPEESLDNSVLVHLPFDGDFSDEKGTTAPTSQGTIEFVDGAQGQGAHFNVADSGNVNSGDYVDLGNLSYGSDSFSVSFLMKLPATNTADNIILSNKDWNNGKNKGFYVGYTSSVKFNAGNSSARVDVRTGCPVLIDDWFLVNMVVDRKTNTMSFYRNGVLMTTAFLSSLGNSSFDAGLPTVIGSDGNHKRHSTSQDFYLDEFMIHSKALSQEEIQVLSDRYGLQPLVDDVKLELWGAEMATEGSEVAMDLNMTGGIAFSKAEITLEYNKNEFSLKQLKNVVTISDYKTETVGGKERLTLTMDFAGKSYAGVDINKVSASTIARIRMECTTGTANPDSVITIADTKFYDCNGMLVTPAQVVTRDNHVEIAETLAADTNGDGLISIGDLTKTDPTGRAAVAAESGFYPYKRVFLLGFDGAGHVFKDSVNWVDKNGKPAPVELKNTPNMDALFAESSYSFNVLSCENSESAENWTAILHGYNAKEVPSEFYRTNTLSSDTYFPGNGTQYPSFFEIFKKQMMNRNTFCYTTWGGFSNGIMEHNTGVKIRTTADYSSNGFGSPTSPMCDDIVEHINNGSYKNAVAVYVSFDDLDNAGHSKGYYGTEYYLAAGDADSKGGQILDALRAQDLMDDTLLVSVADHGGQNTSHGVTNSLQEKSTYLLLHGVTVKQGYTMQGDGQTRDVPGLISAVTGFDSSDTWQSSETYGRDAILAQTELNNGSKETVELVNTAYAKEAFLKVNNVSGDNRVVDAFVSLPDGCTVSDVVPVEGVEILLNKTEEGRQRIIAMKDSAIAEGETLFTVSYEGATGLALTNAMLAEQSGKEIFVNLTTSEISSPADKDELSTLYYQYKNLDASRYSAGSFAAFTEALNEAADVLNNALASQDVIDAARAGLQASIDALVNISTLQKVIALAQGHIDNGDLDNVIPAAKEEFDQAYASATGIAAKADATQDEVDAAWKKLMKVIQGLGFVEGDKTELTALVSQAEALDLAAFENGTEKDAFRTALRAAKELLDDPNAMEADLTAAYDELNAAMEALIPVILEGDKRELQKAYDEALTYDLDRYVDQANAKEAFAEAKEAARLMLEKSGATQEEIDETLWNLLNTMDALRLRADKSSLNEWLDKLKKIDLSKYTDQSAANVLRMIEKAESLAALDLSEDDNALLQAVVAEMEAAEQSLVLLDPTDPEVPDEGNSSKPVDPEEPDEGNSSNTVDPEVPDEGNSSKSVDPNVPDEGDSSNTEEPENSAAGTDSAPQAGAATKTGDSTPIAALAVLTVAAAGVLVLKRRRDS